MERRVRNFSVESSVWFRLGCYPSCSSGLGSRDAGTGDHMLLPSARNDMS